MTTLRSSIEICSLSILGELIELDLGSAGKIFSQLCGTDRETGVSAIRTFHDQSKRDTRWLALLSQINSEMVRSKPQAVLALLTEGFGLYELDAMDVLIHLSGLAAAADISGPILN